MRHHAKPIAKLGLSKATHYDSGLFSFASDLEAMVDRFGAEQVSRFAFIIQEQFKLYGESCINAALNIEARSLPLPKIRRTKSAKKDKRRSKFARAA